MAAVFLYTVDDLRDFDVFLRAANQVRVGESIYTAEAPIYSYLYLPLFAILFVPFTFLPRILSVMIWTILNIALTWWIITVLFRLMTGYPISKLEMKERYLICALAVIPTFEFLLVNLRNGQTNIVMLGFVVGALFLYSRGREAGSGVLIGIAAVVKVFSLPLAFWMFLRRRSLVVFGTLLGITLGLFLPSLIFGWRKNLDYIDFWFRNVAARSDVRTQVVPFHNNTSFEAILARAFSEVPAFDSNHNEYKVTLLAIPEEYLHLAGLILMILLVASIVVYFVRFRNGPTLALEVGGPVLAMLCAPLLTPVSEKYHFVFLLPAYLYIVILWRVYRIRDRLMLFLVIASFAFGTLTLKFFWGDFLSKVWFSYGCIIFCTIFLACAVFRAGAVLSETNDGAMATVPSNG
jgi:hypothetical protein